MNESVLQKLKDAPLATNLTATLTDLDSKTCFEFLYNPEKKEFSVEAMYRAAPTALTSLPAQQYLYTTGRTLKLSDLMMESHGAKKSLRSLLDDLQKLLVADTASGSLVPKLVYFTWGSEKFGAAYLTKLDWTEVAWLSGEPASVRLNMTLIEAPLPTATKGSSTQTILEKQAAESKKRQAYIAALEKKPATDAKDTVASTTPITLTDRQVQDARTKGQEYLSSNTSLLPAPTLALLRQGKLTITANKDGTVYLSQNGSQVTQLGVYDGKTFTGSLN